MRGVAHELRDASSSAISPTDSGAR